MIPRPARLWREAGPAGSPTWGQYPWSKDFLVDFTARDHRWGNAPEGGSRTLIVVGERCAHMENGDSGRR